MLVKKSLTGWFDWQYPEIYGGWGAILEQKLLVEIVFAKLLNPLKATGKLSALCSSTASQIFNNITPVPTRQEVSVLSQGEEAD